MERHEKISRGNSARNLLESEMFNTLMDALLGESFAEYVSTGDLGSEERLAIWARGQALSRIRGQLEYYVSDAQVEVANAEYDNSQ